MSDPAIPKRMKKPREGAAVRSRLRIARRRVAELVHPLPAISPLLLRWFTWYCRGYVRRHFHSLRISINGLPPDATGYPVVLYTNHASWWDPLVGLVH